MPMFLSLDHSDGRYQTRDVEPAEVAELVAGGVTVVELGDEAAARYERHLAESNHWHRLFQKADNEAYAIRHNAGLLGDEHD